MDLDPWLPRAAARRPDHPALLTSDGAVTYTELHAAARDAAAALAALGVGPGARVALALPAGVPFVATLHATLLLGAAVVPIDLRLAPAEQARRATAATILVDEPLTAPPGAPAPPLLDRLDPDAVATVMHTSGTTADPKPVELTFGNWCWNALGSALALGLDADDERWLCTLPLSHVGGLSILLRSAIYGTTVVLHERFDAEAAACALREQRITLASLVATTLARVLDAAGVPAVPAVPAPGAARTPPRPVFPDLRCALLGGAPIAPALADRARAAGVPVAQTYGMTEACSQVTTSTPGEPETAGWALLGQRVRIGDDDEIHVAGPTVAPGATGADGWLRTGDLGRLDERGRLVVTGRKADTIVTGGENVAPQEVEAILLAHPAVRDAGVHGRPDPEWGEAVVATVVLRDGDGAGDGDTAVDPHDHAAVAEQLRAHVAAHLARFKVPKQIAFAESLPRTPSGKLLRRQLG
jgi:O-succinylbenzoic acid--CoA ligase